MRCFPRALLGAAFLAIGLATSGAGAQDTISAAEKLLFQTDHLENVAPPATLSYAFRKTGSAETGFDDTVELRVRALDGAKQASVTFLSAQRKTACPEVTHAEGNPVLMLHGLAESGEAFRRWVPYFATHHLVVRPDLRGYGDSTPMPGDYTYRFARLGEDIIHLLDALKLERVLLIGGKIGGTLAMHIAATYPERVVALAAVGAPASLTSFVDRAPAFNVPGEMAFGNDIFEVRRVASRAIEHARSGRGPYLVEFKTFRRRGHGEHEDMG